MESQYSEVKALLSYPKDILLTSHRNPDGDAIGSTMALYHYLIGKGHTVRVAYPSEYPAAFTWVPAIDVVRNFDTHTEEVTSWIKHADIIFICDYNALDRVDKMGDVMAKSSAKRVMIDHHLYPESCADYMFSTPEASSTCEMVFDFVVALDGERGVAPNVGTCIYIGLVTDTGSFKFSTSPKLFRMVARLLEMGVEDTYIQDMIHNSETEKRLRLLGYCLFDCMEIIDEYNTGIISLSKKDYEDFDIQRGDTEGIVNYILSIRSVRMVAFIMEQPNIVKLSLRSKGDFNVQEICREHFNGGGHKNASGGYSHASLNAVVRKFKEVLPRYKDKLA